MANYLKCKSCGEKEIELIVELNKEGLLKYPFLQCKECGSSWIYRELK